MNKNHIKDMELREKPKMKRPKEVKLGQIAEIKSGKRNSQDATKHGQYPFFDRSQIIKKSDQYIFDDTAVIVAGEGQEFIPRYYHGKFDLHQRAYAIFNFTRQVESKWIYYYLLNKRNYFASVAVGSTVLSLRLNHFQNFPILLPSLSEQKCIANVLSSLDDKIYLLHRQNKTLEDMAQTLFRKWFVEDAEKHWEGKKITDLALHKRININPLKSPHEIFHHYSIPAFDDGKTPIKELGKEIKSNKYQIFKGSILISKLNPRFPRVWPIIEEVHERSICSTEFQVILPIKKSLFGFIYCFLNTKYVSKKLAKSASGTSGSHQRVNPKDIVNLKINKPTDDIIDSFYDVTKNFWLQISNNREQIRTLKNLRDTLLPKLMSGTVGLKR